MPATFKPHDGGLIQSSILVWRNETIRLLKDVSDAPQQEAEWLIEHVTGLSRTHQHADGNLLLTDAQLQQLNIMRQRRISGEPLAYILGEAHFWTLRLKVTPAVLIPRPETELLVERCLLHVRDRSSILDVGTGSGAIALAIAKEKPECRIIACDISTEALMIARDNMMNLQLNNVELIASCWFASIPAQRFDAIVSNPPYIDIDDPHVQKEVRAHEPHLALFADDHGLGALRAIIHDAPRFLGPDGWLILEHGWQQAEKVQELLEFQGWRSVASHPDLSGHLRVTEAQRPLN